MVTKSSIQKIHEYFSIRLTVKGVMLLSVEYVIPILQYVILCG